MNYEQPINENTIDSLAKAWMKLSKQTKNFYRDLSSADQVLKSIGRSVANIIDLKIAKTQLKDLEGHIDRLTKSRESLVKDLQQAFNQKLVIGAQKIDEKELEKVIELQNKAFGDKEKAYAEALKNPKYANYTKEDAIAAVQLEYEEKLIKLTEDLAKRTGSKFEDVHKSLTVFGNDYANLSSKINILQSSATELGNKIKETSKQFMELPNYFAQFIIKYFEEMDTGMANYRRSMGRMISETKPAELQVRRLSTELAHMGATVRDIVEARTTLSGQLTEIIAQDETILSKTIQLNKQFGISNDVTGKFFKTLAGVAGSTTKSQTNMIGFTKAVANAAGIPLNQMMSDIANASDDVRIFMGQTEVSLIKAAATAAQLGVSMNDIASAAKNILSFESSISAELKASALIGKNIDFNEARRLAFQKDTKGMMEEIRRISNEINFNDLNVIQQQAFAQAAGLSVEKLQTMMQREKDLREIRANGTAEQKEQLRQLEKLQAMREDEARSQSARLTKELDSMANQERMLQLQDAWNKMMKELVGPLIDKLVIPLMEIATKYLPGILTFVKYTIIVAGALVTPFITIGAILKTFNKSITGFNWAIKLTESILKSSILSPLVKMSEWLKEIVKLAVGTAKVVKTKEFVFVARILGGISGTVAKILGGLLKWIPILGWVVSVGASILHLWKNWNELVEKFGGGLKGGILAVLNEIPRMLLGPFAFVWDWLVDKFIGHSPSKLGLGIVNGLKAVGGFIVDILTSPFKMWYNVVRSIVKNMIGFYTSMIPNWLKRLFGVSEGSTPTTSIELTPDSKKPETPEVPNPEKDKPTSVVFNETANRMLQYTKENNEILTNLSKVLNNLNDLLISGNIGININGEKLNSELSNVRSQFGEYGKVSKI